MMVARVQDEQGSHIEPPLDESWDRMTKLTWQAAVISVDTGIEIAVGPGTTSVMRAGSWHLIPNTYSVTIRGTTACGSLDFHETWWFLNGIEAGVRAEQWCRRDQAKRTLGVAT
jgi:hypothetical protein